MQGTIPFSYQYTEETGKFLKRVIKSFRIFPLEELKIYMSEFLQTNLDFFGNDDLCKTKITPWWPYFYLEKDNCSNWCQEYNPKYVTFLNDNIVEVKNLLFHDGQTNILMLNAVDSDSGQCVEDTIKKRYNCLCTAKYEIMVSRAFYVSFLCIINENLRWDETLDPNEEIIRKEEFSALAILLKFYPQTAIFYLTYLFYKYNGLLEQPLEQSRFALNILDFSKVIVINTDTDDLPLQPSQYTPFGYITNGNVIGDNSNGMMEDRGVFADNEIYIRIFMKMYELIVNDSCDLRAIGERYYTTFSNRSIIVLFSNIVNNLLSVLISSNK